MPPLLLTPGEPAGIGPDLALLAARDGFCRHTVAVADPTLLRERARLLGLEVGIEECALGDLEMPADSGVLRVWPVPLSAPAQPGRLDPANAGYVLQCLERAADACRDGAAGAMITGPVQKSIINDAGHAFTGHTEFLAERCGTPRPVMLLVAPHAEPAPLRVALATTHLPLRDVAERLSAAALVETGRVLDAGLRRDFGIGAPRIKLTGLNPHAGESGHLGDEETRIIAPAIARLREDGIDALGPFPADTLFTPQPLADCDAVLAMYHDQGLPVLKYAGFGTAVNVTLGLPIVRVSVDHGTALDRAGTGDIDPGSLRAALRMAEEIVRCRANS